EGDRARSRKGASQQGGCLSGVRSGGEDLSRDRAGRGEDLARSPGSEGRGASLSAAEPSCRVLPRRAHRGHKGMGRREFPVRQDRNVLGPAKVSPQGVSFMLGGVAMSEDEWKR